MKRKTNSTTTFEMPSRTPPKKYWAPLLLCLIGLVYAIKVHTKVQDFHVFYLAGQRSLAHMPLYQEGDHAELFKYPPVFAMGMTPFGLLEFGVAKVVWLLLNVITTGLVFWLLHDFTRGAKNSGAWLKHSVLTYLACFIYFDALYIQGQANVFLLFWQLIGVWLIMKQRRFSGGLAIGVAILIKLTPLIFLPYLIVRKQWRALLGAGAGIVGGLTLPVLFYGAHGTWQLMLDWRTCMQERHSLTDPSIFKINDNVEGVIFSLFGPTPVSFYGFSKNLFFFSLPVAEAIFAACVAAIALGYLYLLIKNSRYAVDPVARLFEVAVLLVLQTVLSPFAPKYTFVQLIPLVYFMFLFYEQRYRIWFYLLFVWSVLITVPQSFTPSVGPIIEFYWIHFWYATYLMILAGFVYRSYLRQPPAQTPLPRARAANSSFL